MEFDLLYHPKLLVIFVEVMAEALKGKILRFFLSSQNVYQFICVLLLRKFQLLLEVNFQIGMNLCLSKGIAHFLSIFITYQIPIPFFDFTIHYFNRIFIDIFYSKLPQMKLIVNLLLIDLLKPLVEFIELEDLG